MPTHRKLACCILLLALCYQHVQTNYFGNHWLPTTEGEVLADGLALVIVAIGLNTFSK